MVAATRLRIWLAALCGSIWLFLSLIGMVFGGLSHLLLIAALAVWPWRGLNRHDRRRDRPHRSATREPGDRR